MSDSFISYADQPTAPSTNCFAIVPSDADELPAVTKGIYVGEGGDVTLRSVRGAGEVTFRNLPAGYIIDVRTRVVMQTGTTASSLVGMA